MDDWSEEELAGAVAAYLEMANAESRRLPYNKRQSYRDLAAVFGRTEKAFEYRMQNISAVLAEEGKPWVPGLKPASNVGANVKLRISQLLQKAATTGHRKPIDEPEYKFKLPAIRSWLIQVARAKRTVTYGDLMECFGVGFRNLRRVMDYLGHQSDNLDEPIITAAIVSPKDGKCSPGFAKEFNVLDDGAERLRLYEYWDAHVDEHESQSKAVESESIEVKAARFVSVEVRPDQAAFRRRVFLAQGGRCVVSGCDVPKALDAAHKRGRDWRSGHNGASDGFVLRKDLHALYDCGLLDIDEQGVIKLDPLLRPHYGNFSGMTVISDIKKAAAKTELPRDSDECQA